MGPSMKATSLMVTTLPLAIAAMPLTLRGAAFATGQKAGVRSPIASMAVKVVIVFMVI